MKTSFIYCRSANDSFVIPCFDTTMSRTCIIANLLSCPNMLGNRDLLSYQFRFVGPYISGKSRSKSPVYIIDTDTLASSCTVEFIRIPLHDSLFTFHEHLCSRK